VQQFGVQQLGVLQFGVLQLGVHKSATDFLVLNFFGFATGCVFLAL
jgi:hypothetical protein